MIRFNRKWVKKNSSKKTYECHPLREAFSDFSAFDLSLPPSLSGPCTLERELRPPKLSLLLSKHTAASNAVRNLPEPQFPQLCRSRLSGKGPPSANAT